MRRRPTVVGDWPPRLLAYVLATNIAGVVLTVIAAVAFASDDGWAQQLPAIAVFFAFTLIAELRPVPVDLEGKHSVSLAFMFVVASQLLCSWEASVLIGAIAIAIGQIPDRVQPLKLVFNTSVYAIAAAAASVPTYFAGVHGMEAGYATVTVVVFAAGASFVAVNV